MPPKKKVTAKKMSTKKSVKKTASPVGNGQREVKSETNKLEGKYIEAVGRRKTSIARVRIYEGSPFAIIINDKGHEDYFPSFELRNIVESPITKTNIPKKFAVSVHVNGGGIHSQSEAVRHGISRALEKIDSGYRKVLKPFGFLKRDPRAKERRKFGLKKARKAPQWAKR